MFLISKQQDFVALLYYPIKSYNFQKVSGVSLNNPGESVKGTTVSQKPSLAQENNEL